MSVETTQAGQELGQLSGKSDPLDRLFDVQALLEAAQGRVGSMCGEGLLSEDHAGMLNRTLRVATRMLEEAAEDIFRSR